MGNLSADLERKFTDTVPVSEWEVLSDTGYVPVDFVHKTEPYEEWYVETHTGKTLHCADDHILFDEDMNEIFAKDCVPGDTFIMTEDGPELVVVCEESEQEIEMFDLAVGTGDQRYFANGILSHNTTTAVAVILHYILFNKHKSVAILANKGDAAKEVLERIKLAYESLPLYLQQGVVEWNKQSIEIENGCKVYAGTTSSSAIRGKSIAFLYLDEAAFIEGYDEFFASVYPTISSGETTKLLMTSTPNGLNHYWKTCEGAKEGTNGYKYVEVTWDMVPGRGEAWKLETMQAIDHDEQKFEQEYNCVTPETYVTIRDIETGEVKRITVGELYEEFEAIE
jgi:hypothetical protein